MVGKRCSIHDYGMLQWVSYRNVESHNWSYCAKPCYKVVGRPENKQKIISKFVKLFTTVFIDMRPWKTKHLRKSFQNFHQSYMLSTYRIQSQPLVWPSALLYVMLAGCDWWILIRSVDNRLFCIAIYNTFLSLCFIEDISSCKLLKLEGK